MTRNVTIRTFALAVVVPVLFAASVNAASPDITGPPAATTARRPTVTWTSVPGATWHRIWIASGPPGFTTAYHDEWIPGTTSWQPDWDLPAGQYAVWIRAWGPNGVGGWSAPHEFARRSPSIVSAIDGVYYDGGNIDLVAGSNIAITPDNANNRITISASSGGGGAIGDITAVNAGSGLSGGGTEGDVTLSVAPNGIGSAHIAADAVGASELAPNSVGSSEIATSAVGSSEVVNGSLTTSDVSLSSFDSRYVEVGGDTMTGSLNVAGGVAATSFSGSGANLTGVVKPDDPGLRTGVATLVVNSGPHIPTDIGVLTSKSITVPAAGKVFALCTGSVYIGSLGSGNYYLVRLKLNSGNTANVGEDGHVIFIRDTNTNSGTRSVPFSASRVFTVNAAGTYTYNLSGWLQIEPATYSWITLSDHVLTLLYVPEGY